MSQKQEQTQQKTKKKQKDILVKANKKGRHIIPIINVLRCIVIPFYFLVKPRTNTLEDWSLTLESLIIRDLHDRRTLSKQP